MPKSQSRPYSPAESDPDHRAEKRPRLEGNFQTTGPIYSYQGATEQADGKSEKTLPQFAQTVAAGEPSSQSKAPKKKSKHKKVIPEPYSGEFVVARDVENLLGQETVKEAIAGGTEWDAPFTGKEEIELIVSGLSSTGDSLSIAPSPRKPWVIVTPLALPGEKIRVRVYRHARLYSHADLLEVVMANPEWRDMTRVQCEYFGKCAGCQYQMLSYETQLQLKRNAVVKAYENFSGLLPSSIPAIPETIGSPLQYGYRTKITPHFDALPKKLRKDTKNAFADSGAKPDWLKIGFNQIGTRQVMDIEECPIATPTLNEALPSIRQNVIQNARTYKKGVSLLLRDSLTIPTEPMTPSALNTTSLPEVVAKSGDSVAVSVTQCDAIDGLAAPPEKHVCVTNHRATVRERVGDTLFEYTAGSFFQNNNSVLLSLTSYVRDAIFPPFPSFPTSAPTHLVDAYCGSGLFAITLAPYFQQVAGIEISEESIRCATRNAELNCLPMGRCKFMAGDAANIFATVQDFPREHTALIIDPPRKGTDEKFIDQLLQFNCATVVYVSCNVHTQARDVGMILRKSEQRGGCKYVMQSLRGFDLFPQTAHVESVAVLRLV